MTEFETRLLLPHSSATPAHIVVDSHPSVYAELNNPRMTAAVFVPNWSAPVCEAFARIAALSPDQQSNFEDRIDMGMFSQGDIEDFALDTVIKWLKPVFKPQAREENIHVVREVASAQSQFAHMANTVLRHEAGRRPYYYPISRRLNVNEEADTRLQPHLPQTSLAHTDPNDNGLFSFPLGTVLVDQTGLDIKALREADTRTTRKGQLIHRIALSHLANRLWQIPDGCFALWRGEGHASVQYHFFPHITHDMQRFRAFAHP